MYGQDFNIRGILGKFREEAYKEYLDCIHFRCAISIGSFTIN